MSSLLWLVLGWFVLTGAFVLVMHCKVMRDSGRLTLFWRVNVLPWFVVGLLLDVSFNLVAGTLMYLELPRELTFTSRCSRHKDNVRSHWRRELAWWWCDQLGQVDPGHC